MATPWWLNPTATAANFTRARTPSVVSNMDWPTPQSTGVKSAAAGALGIPQFLSNITPNLPEESINTIQQMAWKRLAGVNALKGAYGAAAQRDFSFSDYLGGQELMPARKGPSELQGALQGLFAGLAPTAAKKAGINIPSIEESMLKMGEPWWSANIANQAITAYEYGAPDLVKAAWGIVRKPATLAKTAGVYAEVQMAKGEPFDIDAVGNMHEYMMRRPWYEAEGLLQEATKELGKVRGFPKGPMGGIPTRPAASLYSGLPVGEGQFKFPWTPSATETGIQAAAESAGQRFLRGASALVPAIKDTFTGEIITDPSASIHGQVLARNPKFDELVDKPSVIRGYINAEGKFLDRDTIATDEDMPIEARKPDARQLFFGARVAAEPGYIDPITGQVPLTSTNAEDLLARAATKYPALSKIFPMGKTAVHWAKRLGNKDFFGHFTSMGEQGAISLSEQAHVPHGGKLGAEALDTLSEETMHGLQDKILRPWYNKLKEQGLITEAQYQEFMHPENFQMAVGTLNDLLVAEPSMRAKIKFTGNITAKNPYEKPINRALEDAQEMVNSNVELIKNEALNPVVKKKFRDLIFDAIAGKKINQAERFRKWRTEFGLAKKEGSSIEAELARNAIERGSSREEFVTRLRRANTMASPSEKKIDIQKALKHFGLQEGVGKSKAKFPEEVPKPIESTPDLFESSDLGTPQARQMEELFKNAAMLPPERMPAPPPEVPPPPKEVQPFLDLKEEEMLPREYRDIGVLQRFSNPNVYAEHAGYGPEHSELTKAYDKFTVVRQRLGAEAQHVEELFKKQMPWFKKTGGSKNVDDLKKAFMFELENPEGSDFSAFSPELQKLGKEIRAENDKIFWEENRARVARGEEPIPYKRGYMYRMYKDEMIAQIKENNPVGPELTSGFESGINTDLGFSPGESRTAFGEKHPEAILWDPVASYFKRRELHEREMLLRPALDKVAENVKKLELIGTPYPRQIMNQMNDFIKYTIKGQPLPANEALDKSFNAIPWLSHILGPKPFTKGTQALLRLQYLGTLWGNLRQYTRNPLQSINHISMYGVPNALKGLNRMLFHGARAEGTVEKELRYPFLGLEKQPIRTVMQKIESIGFAPLQQTDMFNLIHCYETAKAWGESLEVNKGWNDKMEAEAIADKLPADTYKWTAEDTQREADFAIQVNQFKYTITGMPEIYRNQLGKVVGGLYSWPMNYFNTFMRELVYRAYTGKTGWSSTDGVHKPIPTAARLAALQYLILTAAAMGLTEQVGIDYGSQVLMGAVPSGFNPITNIAMGTIGLALGSYRLRQNPADKWAKMDVAKAKYQIGNSLKTLIPGRVALRTVGKVAKGEKPWWSIVAHTKPEPPRAALPTKQNINAKIFKGLEKPPSKGSTKWLTQ